MKIDGTPSEIVTTSAHTGEVVSTTSLHEPAIELAKIITGALSLDKHEWVKRAGSLVQSAIQGRFKEKLDQMVDGLKKAGNLDEDFIQTGEYIQTFTELLDYLENETIADEERLKIIVQLFSIPLTKKTSDTDRFLAYEFIKIARELAGIEIRILRACYDIKSRHKRIEFPDAWASEVAGITGLGLQHIIFKYEDHLVRLNLIGAREGREITERGTGRLTDLGIKFTEFIAEKSA